jgi:hypothetical protein
LNISIDISLLIFLHSLSSISTPLSIPISTILFPYIYLSNFLILYLYSIIFLNLISLYLHPIIYSSSYYIPSMLNPLSYSIFISIFLHISHFSSSNLLFKSILIYYHFLIFIIHELNLAVIIILFLKLQQMIDISNLNIIFIMFVFHYFD